ncbi:subtilisin-like protein [Lactarius quietus]|nr:subtilisin-like protein [Lactarius quietus]
MQKFAESPALKTQSRRSLATMHHHRHSLLFALAAALLGGAATSTPLSPNWNKTHTKHGWNAVPGKWDSIGRPPMGTTIDLRIALKPQNENALLDALYEVSNPKHPRYGAYLSKEQVAELVAPHPDTLKLVESWLGHHGVSLSNVSRSHGGGWLTVTGVPVSKANDLLGASYHLFQHAETKETIIRTLSYALPSALHRHVQTVAPTTYFGSPGTLQQKPLVHHGGAVATRAPSGGPRFIIPTLLRSMYKSEEYVPAATDRNVLGIAGFHGQYASHDDLEEFMNNFRSDASDATFSVVEIDSSGYDDNDPGTEANLNMQYAQAIAYPTPHVFYSIGGAPPPFIPSSFQQENNNEPWLDWLGHMIDLPDPPQTLSASYGGNEQTFPPEYAVSVCDLFKQLGARGVSLLFASGDSGVGGGDCQKNDGSGDVEFQPTFPSTCPYVTSVGGTKGKPETAAELSSGGFSNVFKLPPYQDDAVGNFFHLLGDQNAGLYNASSRGFPDVSSQAVNFKVILDNFPIVGGGTSCAAPVVAGLISLLNDYRLYKKRPPLGFLNPWLYSGARLGFNDITSGSNPGCGTEGFSAVPGWDPVTGLGTLDFGRLLGILSVRVD